MPAENIAEYKILNQKRHKRRNYAPEHAEQSPLVFLFEISFGKLLEKESVLFYLFDKRDIG